MEDHTYFNHLLDQREKQKLIAEYDRGRDDERDAVLRHWKKIGGLPFAVMRFIEDVEEGRHRTT